MPYDKVSRVGIKVKYEISRVKGWHASFLGRQDGKRAPRRMYPLSRAFSREKSFPRFPAPANRDTWLRRSNSRRNGLKKGLVGRERKTGEWKTARNGASLVARNSTRAFLEFTAARDYAGDTNFARTFPWKRPLPSSWVEGEKGIGEGDVAETTDS